MLETLNKIVEDFKKSSKNKIVKIITHYDTDGITGGAILVRALKREDIKFNIRIEKQLEKEILDNIKTELKDNEILFFVDLGSSFLSELKEINKDIFILDHHEIENIKIPKNIRFINPHIFKNIEERETSASALVYLFVKELNKKNKDMASLAVLGMVGDMVEKSLTKMNNSILQESDVVVKRGLLLFSATRPIHKSLEFSSEFFIPGVTGSPVGVRNILREVGIERNRTLLDLNEEETSKLITSIILRRIGKDDKKDIKDIIGNIYLIKFFNRMEDARELSTLINSCSRLGYGDVAISFCLGNNKARMRAESIYNTYKYKLISGLNFVEQNKEIGKNYVLINAKKDIDDGVISAVTSIVASSFLYKEGTIVIGMAYKGDKIKVSIRKVGKNDLNLKKFLSKISDKVGGEAGGHEKAAGCLILKDKEKEFLDVLKKELKEESIKIKI